MSRAREVKPGSGEMPDYKSPPSRLVHSLRGGYDNLRDKLKEVRDEIKYYQIKTRDLEKSREKHKEESKELAAKVKQLEKENAALKKQNTQITEKKKTL